MKTTQGQFWSVSRKSVAGMRMMEDQLEVLGYLLLQSSLPGPFTYARNFPDHRRNTTNSSIKHFWHCFRSTPCASIYHESIERMTYTYIANPGFFFGFYLGKISMAAYDLPAFGLSRSLTPHQLDRSKKPSEQHLGTKNLVSICIAHFFSFHHINCGLSSASTSS